MPIPFIPTVWGVYPDDPNKPYQPLTEGELWGESLYGKPADLGAAGLSVSAQTTAQNVAQPSRVKTDDPHHVAHGGSIARGC